MQFEWGKPPETPNAPYRAARIKEQRWRSAGPGLEPEGPAAELNVFPGRLHLRDLIPPPGYQVEVPWPCLLAKDSAGLGLACLPMQGLLALIAACSTGVVDRGVWLRISRENLSCALVRSRGIVFRHFYRSLAKSAGKIFRDGAVVPFE
jgi:hypothetical protein